MSEQYNTDLLMQVREKIENEPEKHRQVSWAFAQSDPREGGECGTAYCVAGWACVLDGQELAWGSESQNHWEADYLATGAPIWTYAQETLGLRRAEGDALFASGNSRSYTLSALDLLIEAGKNGERLAEGEL